tara:strand:- start:1449 stop:1727 length:279 start_codon:yes stop_codon:yes gene_type:complete
MIEENEDGIPMSHWNFRVIRKETDHSSGKYVTFGIYEVYYTEGKPTACTMEMMSPHGETLDELKQDIEWYQLALSKPVLDFDKDFPQEESDE